MATNFESAIPLATPNHNHIHHYQNDTHSTKNMHTNLNNGTRPHNHHNGASSSSSIASDRIIKPKLNSSILHPIPMKLTTYKSPLHGNKNRKRLRAMNDTAPSPNVNNGLTRKRRKLSPKPLNHISSCLPSLVSLSPVAIKPKKPQPTQQSKKPPQKPKPTKRNTHKNSKTTKSKPKKKRVAVEDWSETDQDYSDDDDYLPPRNAKTDDKNKNKKKNKRKLDTDLDSDVSQPTNTASTTPSGYRRLNWRKKQVATPKFIVIDADYDGLSVAQPMLSRHQSVPIPNTLPGTGAIPPALKASASTMDMYGLEGEKLEDTSNTAYFYRHYRAEAREKKFYEELFESRLKHQQILEEKERRKRKHKQKKNKKTKNIKRSENSNGINSDEAESDGRNENENEREMEEDDIDLTLPTLPKGPWSFTLGPEYDKRPQVPTIVTNRPQFNYHIPFEQLQRKQFIANTEERKQWEHWWKMPPHLIRRTDYGNAAQIKVALQPNVNTNTNSNHSNSSLVGDVKRIAPHHKSITNEDTMEKIMEQKKKQQLIDLYVQLKQHQKAKKITNKKEKKKHKKKHKHKKKKSKHRDKEKKKSKHKTIKATNGPVDVRLLLKK